MNTNLVQDKHILAAVTVNGASASATPFIHSMQPVLSAILTIVQIGVAIVTLLILIHKLKSKNLDKE